MLVVIAMAEKRITVGNASTIMAAVGPKYPPAAIAKINWAQKMVIVSDVLVMIVKRGIVPKIKIKGSARHHRFTANLIRQPGPQNGKHAHQKQVNGINGKRNIVG